MTTETYQIKLDEFEGPFDLLLFFIERDELDIYNIPITKITNDFLNFIHHSEKLNIELSSEFILFISTLMRIKAKMLIPRKEIDAQGNEIDPRQELINKILEYKKFKEASPLIGRPGNGVEVPLLNKFISEFPEFTPSELLPIKSTLAVPIFSTLMCSGLLGEMVIDCPNDNVDDNRRRIYAFFMTKHFDWFRYKFPQSNHARQSNKYMVFTFGSNQKL